jgi:hypothetical protein
MFCNSTCLSTSSFSQIVGQGVPQVNIKPDINCFNVKVYIIYLPTVGSFRPRRKDYVLACVPRNIDVGISIARGAKVDVKRIILEVVRRLPSSKRLGCIHADAAPQEFGDLHQAVARDTFPSDRLVVKNLGCHMRDIDFR